MKSMNWLKSVLFGLCLGAAVMALGQVIFHAKGSDDMNGGDLTSEVASSLQPIKQLPRVVNRNSSTRSSLAASETVLAQALENRSFIRLCDGFGYSSPQDLGPGQTNTSCDANPYPDGFAHQGEQFQGQHAQDMMSVKQMRGIDQNTPHPFRREPRWRNGDMVPWEQYAYGEYLGPFRTPHMDEYRIRIGDQIELNFIQVRPKTHQKYQLNVGDLIQISSPNESSLLQPSSTTGPISGLQIMPDGTVSLALIGEIRAAGKTVADLQRELNDKYLKYVKNPSIVIQVTKSDTPVLDLLEAVDSRFGQGGRSRQVTISPDGTLQLPLIGSVPAIGLSLNELRREINARYRERLHGIEVTPILTQRAPRFVYVVGEVRNSGRYEMNGPTTAMQAVALAGGFDRRAGNLRQIIVFRRDQNWQLVATKLDLSAAFYGKSPRPSDEIWLRDSDIILIPPKPIQRFSDAVNLYMTNTLYSIFPQQGVNFNFDSFRSL